MITSFHCPDTEALFLGKRVARFANIAASAMRKLAILNRVKAVEELRIPPGNRQKNFPVTVKVSSASVSMTNGACALALKMETLLTLRLWTTTKGDR